MYFCLRLDVEAGRGGRSGQEEGAVEGSFEEEAGEGGGCLNMLRGKLPVRESWMK